MPSGLVSHSRRRTRQAQEAMAHAAMEITGGGSGTSEQGSSRRSGCRCAGGSPPVAAQHQVRKEHGPRNTRLRSGLYIDNAQGAPRRDEQNPLGGDPTRDYVLSSDGSRRRNTTGGVHERPVAAAAALGRLVRRGRRPLRERQRRWQRRKRQWHTSHAKQDQDGGTDTARPRRQGQDGRAKTAGPRRQGRATGRRRRRWVKRQRLCGYEYAQCVCRWPSEIGTDRHGISICSSRQTDLGTPPIAPCTRPNSTQCPRAPATTAPPCAAGGHRRERLTRLRCQHHLV